MRTTMTTTTAMNTGVTAGGTPRNVMVDLRVWMVKTRRRCRRC